MDIDLVTIGVQPVGIVSLKDGASRPPGFDDPELVLLLTQYRFLALVGFKVATEVYAIVEGPRVCINAFVDLPSVKFCGKVFGVPIPCGFSWGRIRFEIIVRHTHMRTTMHLSSPTTTEAHRHRTCVPLATHSAW